MGWHLICATAVNLWLSPGLSVMEGCGKVGQVARMRIVQSVIGYSLFWMALILGAVVGNQCYHWLAPFALAIGCCIVPTHQRGNVVFAAPALTICHEL